MNNFFNGLGSLSIFTNKINRYNPNTQYVWIVFNDNNSIVYNDGKKIVYEE